MDGNIVVDGLLASCYASIDHDLGNIGMAPVQWFPEIALRIFGVDEISPSRANIAEELQRWLLPFGPKDII